MKEKYKIIKKQDTQISKWFGGEIYKYFVYPKGSNYDNKDFTLALVGASVKLKESEFTNYTGYNRIIMTIDNDLNLNHNGGDMICLKKHELYAYDGGDFTKSYGSADDFNIISKKDQAFGEVRAIKLAEDSIIEKNIAVLPNGDTFEFIFCIEGTFNFKTEKEEYTIEKEDLIVINLNNMDEDYKIIGIKESKIVLGTFICK